MSTELSGDLELPQFLLETEQFDACALEFLRQGFLHAELRDVAMERAALCLQRAGRYDAANRIVERLLSEFGIEAVHGKAVFRLCIGNVVSSKGLRMRACRARLASLELRSDLLSMPYVGRALYVPVMASLLSATQPDPVQLLSWKPAGDPVLQSWVAQDIELAGRIGVLPHRKPWLAGLLSAVVPGLGRGYVGRPKDGIVTFFMTAVPGAITAFAYSRRGADSASVWISGGVTAAMYLGNIYGSVVGGRMYNLDQREQLRGEIFSVYARRLDP